MTNDPLLLSLLVLLSFWIGFSLSFVLFSTFTSINPLTKTIVGATHEGSPTPLPTAVRLIATLFVFAGLAGFVAYWGLMRRYEVQGASLAFLIGVPCGIWLAHRLFRYQVRAQ